MSESSDALATLPPAKDKLATSLASEINELHDCGLKLDDTIRKSVSEKIRLTIAIGELLNAAKASFSSHQFDAFCRRLNFDQPCLRSYVRIAARARRIDDFKSQWKMIGEFEQAKAAGLIQPGTKQGEQVHAPNFFQSASRQIANLVIAWKKFISMRPLAKWSDDELASFSVELKSVSDARAQIEREIARRRSE